MSLIHRVPVNYAGSAIVGLAENVIYLADDGSGTPDVAGLRAAYLTLAGNFPSSVVLTFPTSGDSVESTTGVLQAVWTDSPQAAVVGGGTDVAAAGVGGCVTWATNGIHNGHKTRGRTFLVPYSTSSYEANGTLVSAAQTREAAFITAMLGLGQFVIWHRPTSIVAADGAAHPVVDGTARDKVAFLSSRRD